MCVIVNVLFLILIYTTKPYIMWIILKVKSADAAGGSCQKKYIQNLIFLTNDFNFINI